MVNVTLHSSHMLLTLSRTHSHNRAETHALFNTGLLSVLLTDFYPFQTPKKHLLTSFIIVFVVRFPLSWFCCCCCDMLILILSSYCQFVVTFVRNFLFLLYFSIKLIIPKSVSSSIDALSQYMYIHMCVYISHLMGLYVFNIFYWNHTKMGNKGSSHNKYYWRKRSIKD